MVNFPNDLTLRKLGPGDAVYPGDLILSMDDAGLDQVIFRQYTATEEAVVLNNSPFRFFLVSRSVIGEPRAFGSIVRNRDREEFVFDGREWRRENGRPTTWDAIAEGAPIEVVRDGLRG